MNKTIMIASLLASIQARPSSAADDILVDTAAQATEEIQKFHSDLASEERHLAGYAEMNDEEKAEFEILQNEWNLKRKERDEAEYQLVGYDDMTTLGKATYNSELLHWKIEVYEACNNDPASDECMTKDEIREYTMTLKNNPVKCIEEGCEDPMTKNGKGEQVPKRYWDMSTNEKRSWETANEEDVQIKESTLVAAAIEEPYVPPKGARKSDCSQDKHGQYSSCNKGLCCGRALSSTGKKDICNWSGNTKFTETLNGKSTQWTFNCQLGNGSIYISAAMTALAGLYLTI